VLLMATYKPSKVMFHFIADLLEVRLILVSSLCSASDSNSFQASGSDSGDSGVWFSLFFALPPCSDFFASAPCACKRCAVMRPPAMGLLSEQQPSLPCQIQKPVTPFFPAGAPLRPTLQGAGFPLKRIAKCAAAWRLT